MIRLKAATIPGFDERAEGVDPLFERHGELALPVDTPPVSWRGRSAATRLADLKAMVTPEEKIGSRNSPALPSNAYPRAHSEFTLLA